MARACASSRRRCVRRRSASRHRTPRPAEPPTLLLAAHNGDMVTAPSDRMHSDRLSSAGKIGVAAHGGIPAEARKRVHDDVVRVD